MTVEQGAVRANDDHGVVKSPSTERTVALVEAAHDRDPRAPRRFAQRTDVVRFQVDRRR